MTDDKNLTGRERSNKNLKPAKLGEVRNPTGKGLNQCTADLKFARQLSKEFVEIKLTQFLQYTVEELELILADKTRPTIDHFIGKIVELGIKYGDHQRFNFMLDRLVGKIKDVKEFKLPAPTIIKRLDGSEVELGSKMVDAEIIDME